MTTASITTVNPTACDRVATALLREIIYPDSDVAHATRLNLVANVVGVEHGFANWNDLLHAPAVEQLLAVAMLEIPDLCSNGLGVSNPRMMPENEAAAMLAQDRKALRADVVGVTKTIKWLVASILPTRSINKRWGSYGLKHVAEKEVGYITNGTFIAAAIIVGYPCARIGPGSPNTHFGMCEASIIAKVRELDPSYYP